MPCGLQPQPKPVVFFNRLNTKAPAEAGALQFVRAAFAAYPFFLE